MRVETPSVNYMLFDESTKKLAKQKSMKNKLSKVKKEVRKVSKAKLRKKSASKRSKTSTASKV